RDQRRGAKQWAELVSFVVGELGDARHVAAWLHDQRSETERADAMLDQPVSRLVDTAADSGCVPFAGSHAMQLSIRAVSSMGEGLSRPREGDLWAGSGDGQGGK